MFTNRPFILLALTSLGFAANAIAQTAQPVIPDLQGRLVAIRFFSSGNSIPSRATRLYSSRFDATASRYINIELEFAFPRPGRVIEFPVTCQFLKADGSVAGTVNLRFAVQPDWDNINNATGWGSENAGFWAPGIYRTRCNSASSFVGEASFEVVQASVEIAAANAKFSSLRFFESPRPMLALKDRKYSQTFSGAEARSIGVELSFDAPAPGRVIDFGVVCRILSSDGSEVGTFDISFQIQPDWKGIINANTWGWEAAGKWAKGVYRASCSSGGKWIADGLFEIV
jgi:hypothetical protein